MNENEKFLVGTVLVGLLAAEARDLPATIQTQKNPDSDVRSAVYVRWAITGAIILLALYLCYGRGNNE